MVATFGERLTELTGGKHAWLSGRWSYEQLLTYWNTRGAPLDGYLLTIAPLVLGTGRRRFPEGLYTSLQLTDSTTTGTGGIVATDGTG